MPSPSIPPAWRRAAAGLALLAVVAVTSACHRPAEPVAEATSPAASPRPTVTMTPTPTPAPVRPACRTPRSTSNNHPASLEAYLARIPCFGPAPKPVPVVFPQGPAAEFRYDIPTNQPVAFITIDDGTVQHDWLLPMIKEAGVPVTFFLGTKWVPGHVDYWREFVDTGLVDIEGHTVNHVDLRGLSHAQQKKELCDSTDAIEQWFGRRPVFFRPPFGEIAPNRKNPESSPTMKAAWECGLQAGFYWRETVSSGKVYYQRGATVRPGDILLLHFGPGVPEDFLAALAAIKKAGLTPARLSDYFAPVDPA